VSANEILGDAERRAAYDHLLALAHHKQEQVGTKQAAPTRSQGRFRQRDGVPGDIGVAVGRLALFVATVGERLYACNRPPRKKKKKAVRETG